MSEEQEKKAFTDPEEITLVNGEKVVLPRLTIGKILALTEGMDELISTAKQKAPGIFELFNGGAENNPAELVQALPQLIPLLLSQIVKVLSTYLGKDKKWVEENMDLEDLVAVATPFFGSTIKQANHILGPLNNLFKKANANPSTPQSPES